MKCHVSTIVLIFFVHTSLFAGVTGKISGYVTDMGTGEPLIGCNVLIGGTYLGAATSLNGDFVILNVPPGTYTLRATMIGYTTVEIEGVLVAIDLTTNVNIEMKIEVIQGETVLVVYDRPIVQRDRTSSQVHLSEDFIANLPVQEITEILEMQSGVTRDPGGGIHIRGGRGSEVVYWVDGIPVTDGYDGGQTVEVDKNAIQELQLVTGTFNAEYGQAMSGIINIVTRTGGEDYSGSFEVSTGGYWATADNIMVGLDTYDPLKTQNYSASLGGPVFTEKIRFCLAGRKYISDGWLRGFNYFTTTGESGDSSIANMNWQDKLSANGKLSIFLTSKINLHLNALISRRDYQDYDNLYKWNPGGDLLRFRRGQNYSLSLNHTLNPRTFYTIKASNSFSDYRHYQYKNPLDSRYVHPDSLNIPSYTFCSSGTNLSHFHRTTNTSLIRFDFTSQISLKHLIKIGAEYRNHKLELDDFSVLAKTDEFGVEIVPFEPDTFDISSPSHKYYLVKPEEFSFYIPGFK